ncbi:MAG: isoleucine--tRNA ligase [Thermodesulfobacteriota bacterium]
MDYKDSLNLPKTEFQMKASLPKTEPEAIRRWDGEGLYRKIMEAGKGREKYTLHDGPPYANGRIHMGHTLNKILKDIVVKSRFMSGFSTDYVPGWDCHGLPIELQVEKDLGKKKEERGKNLSKPEIRKQCREYAGKYVEIQREEFKRLGIFGQWDEPYLTMDFSYQAAIMRELGKVHAAGLVYPGKKPVHWCASCRTALAEAEVEYADKESPSVFVKFRVKDSKGKFPGDRDTYLLIWTTTPWTLPANLAVAVHPEINYKSVKVGEEVWVLAEELVGPCMEKFGIEKYEPLDSIAGSELEGIVCTHPFIDRESKVLTAGFVTTEAGTGCVHIAPGHGQDDYQLGLRHGLDTYAPVDNYGKFTKEFPEFEGQFVFKANSGINALMQEKGVLIKEEKISHSYPHCWRCKKPIIFRATEQWFVSMEEKDLRKRTLEAIDKVEWIPSWGRDRIYGMIEKRPDWCLSRQRAWGVPIPALNCKGCDNTFLDKKVIDHMAEAFEKEGADIWFERGVGELVPSGVKCPECGGTEFHKEEDILDVWFDSGVSFAAVTEKRENLKSPADLYLEGSDQHRGWFHSSLLASMATRNRPPYGAVLTHGFVVDGKGRKMSKSLGNVMAPQKVIDRYGAEVLRLWVAGEDYREDIRISEETLKRLSEAYRRIRNTFRYILGNLYDFDPEKDSVAYDELGELDRLTLHRLEVLSRRVLKAYDEFEFHTIYHAVHNFCSVDLSSFYLDIIKDRLYTSKADSKERRAAQTIIYNVLDRLLRLTAPLLVFTTDEAWGFIPGKREESVHLSGFSEPREEWLDDGLAEKWEKLLRVKDELSRALEEARKAKVIGHSLDAKVTVVPTPELKELLTEEAGTLKEMLIVSQLELSDAPPEGGEGASEFPEIQGLKASIGKADGEKCERCWNYSPTVGESSEHPAVCERCLKALT